MTEADDSLCIYAIGALLLLNMLVLLCLAAVAHRGEGLNNARANCRNACRRSKRKPKTKSVGTSAETVAQSDAAAQTDTESAPESAPAPADAAESAPAPANAAESAPAPVGAAAKLFALQSALLADALPLWGNPHLQPVELTPSMETAMIDVDSLEVDAAAPDSPWLADPSVEA